MSAPVDSLSAAQPVGSEKTQRGFQVDLGLAGYVLTVSIDIEAGLTAGHLLVIMADPRTWVRGSFLVFCSAPLRSIRLATLLNDNRERHSNSVARIIMGCECFLMRAEWRTSLDS